MVEKKSALIISHRGGRSWAPENTLAAFRMSLEIGADGLELDVHRCASGELVVIHDESVNRTTNGVGLIEDITCPELKRLSAGAWWDEEHGEPGEHRFSDERIPLLEEVLDLVDGRALINIELKNAPVAYPGIEEDLLSLLEGYRHKEKIIVSSFDHKLMLALKKSDPSIKTALLADALFVDMLSLAGQIGAGYWHPCFGSLRQDAVEEAHQAEIIVNAWTINNPREWATAIEWGIDGIVTDDPEGLVKFLKDGPRIAARPARG